MVNLHPTFFCTSAGLPASLCELDYDSTTRPPWIFHLTSVQGPGNAARSLSKPHSRIVVSCTVKFQEPQMGQHHHLDLAAKDSTPLTVRIISRYITFFTISRKCLLLFGSSVTVAAATVNTPLLALHCLYSMRPVVYIRSILLSAPQIVSQALTFDFRPSGCELVDCHSDGHKALQSFLRTECECVNQLTYSCCCCCSRSKWLPTTTT